MSWLTVLGRRTGLRMSLFVNFHIVEMTGNHYAEMRAWRYPPPYDFEGASRQVVSGDVAEAAS